jgi:hypothetical protein
MSILPYDPTAVQPGAWEPIPPGVPFAPCDWPDQYDDEAPALPDDLFFDPSEADEDWLATQHHDGGCAPDDLSPEEAAELAGTLTEADYAADYLDPGLEPEPTPDTYCLF